MNARQKAKKYKRMFEQLLDQIDTFRFEEFHPKYIAGWDYIVGKPDDYVKYSVSFDPYLNKYRLTGKIKVVHTKEKCRK